MKTDKFNYDLPEHLIAQYPSPKRTDSKLLVAIESIQHDSFKDIGNHINKGDLLILIKHLPQIHFQIILLIIHIMNLKRQKKF